MTKLFCGRPAIQIKTTKRVIEVKNHMAKLPKYNPNLVRLLMPHIFDPHVWSIHCIHESERWTLLRN